MGIPIRDMKMIQNKQLEIQQLNKQTTWNLAGWGGGAVGGGSLNLLQKYADCRKRVSELENRIGIQPPGSSPDFLFLEFMPFLAYLHAKLGLTCRICLFHNKYVYFITNRIWRKWRYVVSKVIKALQILLWSPGVLIWWKSWHNDTREACHTHGDTMGRSTSLPATRPQLK